jgi:hypothetical protein
VERNEGYLIDYSDWEHTKSCPRGVVCRLPKREAEVVKGGEPRDQPHLFQIYHLGASPFPLSSLIDSDITIQYDRK